jgi:hypothetical protein
VMNPIGVFTNAHNPFNVRLTLSRFRKTCSTCLSSASSAFSCGVKDSVDEVVDSGGRVEDVDDRLPRGSVVSGALTWGRQ